MRLKFISDEALIDLRANFDTYKDYYYNQDDEWFHDYFSKEGRVLESTVECDMPEFNYDENYSISDRENVKIVYEALKHLTPSQATQEKLWAGLAHLQFRDYTFYRLKEDIEKKNERRINSFLFFRHGTKRSLFVHGISRLWWVGYMTYDEENRDNPYWLTDFFCESDFSARATIFFSSNFTSNREITKGILRALYKLREHGVTIKRAHFVEANKYLNIVGAALILDILTSREIENKVGAHLCKHFGLENIFTAEEQLIL